MAFELHRTRDAEHADSSARCMRINRAGCFAKTDLSRGTCRSHFRTRAIYGNISAAGLELGFAADASRVDVSAGSIQLRVAADVRSGDVAATAFRGQISA